MQPVGLENTGISTNYTRKNLPGHWWVLNGYFFFFFQPTHLF